MATPSRYPQEGNLPPPYYTHRTPVGSTDSGHSYGPEREMGPPSLAYPPQVLEIDTSSSKTLPSPLASTPATWEPSPFQLHGFGDVPTYGSLGIGRQVSVEGQSRGTAQHSLLHWYYDNDGPWTPKSSLSEPPKGRDPRSGRSGLISMQHLNPYDQRIPSDAGTYPAVPPSDSGYGTRRSDANSSNFSADVSDRDQDGQSLTGPGTEFQQYPGISEISQQRDPHGYGWVAPDTSISDSRSKNALVCPTCHKLVKTRSELKKHDLRHKKPFICRHSDCSRVGGFSTRNDLERHVKSKHPSVLQGSEPTKRYRCLVQGCKSREKSWPRLDNFRSHLKRVHHRLLASTEDFEEMVRRAEYIDPIPCNISQDHSLSDSRSLPEVSPEPPSTVHQSLTRPSSMTADWRQMYPDMIGVSQNRPSPKEPPFDVLEREPTPDELTSLCDFPDGETVQPPEDLQVSISTKNDPALESTPPPSLSLRGTRPAARNTRFSPQGKAKLHRASISDATITAVIKTALAGVSLADQGNGHTPHHHPEWNESSCKSTPEGLCQSGPNSGPPPTTSDINHVDSPAGSESSIDSEAQRKAIEVLKTLHDLGYIVQKDPTHPTKPCNQGSVASSKSENLVTCQKCGKFKGRPCELKKHMKRHSRPYGCTFPACNNKTFGSKNDWKRHENSQHIHLETWRCDEEKPQGGVCAKVCYRKQSFTDHLQKDHLMSNNDAVATKAKSCHIGRNCQARFWCGFCVKPIDLKKKGVDAWAERFDHIDNHFMGRHGFTQQSIQDWLPADSSERPKGDVQIFHDLSPSPQCDPREDASLSPDSRSSNGSPVEGSYTEGPSSGDAVIIAFMDEGPKRKRTDGDESKRPAKQRGRAFTGRMVVYCCQCHTYHNPKLDESCTMCDDSHRFCDNCVVEPMGFDEDRSPADLP